MIKEVQEALNPVIESLGYCVAWPNKHYEPDDDPYLRVNYLWSRAELQTLKCGRQPGILQIDCFSPGGDGAIDCADIADQVLAKFPVTTMFTYNTTTVHIDSIPYPGPSFNDNGRYFIPVSIPFEVQA